MAKKPKADSAPPTELSEEPPEPLIENSDDGVMVPFDASDFPNPADLAGTSEVIVPMVTDHVIGEEEMEIPDIPDELEFMLEQERILHDRLPGDELPEIPERYER